MTPILNRRSAGRRVAAAAWALATGRPAQANVDTDKVLRVAFTSAETGFDPPRLVDNTSLTLSAHLFEGLYGYDPLARPARLVPVSAAAMPEPSADFRTWTVRLKRGIHFTDDPAFGGAKRELVAEDFVYSMKRYADPAVNSPLWSDIEQIGIDGLSALRQRALDTRQAFDYDREIAGLRALDRYTLQFRLKDPRPRLVQSLTGFYTNAVAREVVKRYGDSITEHPVGTGPFRLGAWRRSSQIVLLRNPGYREAFYESEPEADDAQGQAIRALMRGRRLPMVDRVEVAIIEGGQPLWLAFMRQEIDQVAVPSDFAAQAMPGGRLAPYLQRRGVRGELVLDQSVRYLYFNMEDELVGGYTADKVALRRAIGLGLNVERQISVLYGGQAAVAHSPIGAHLSGFDPAFRSESGEYSPLRARALLDVFGYIDRDGDGWRERPDGKPLTLVMGTMGTPLLRARDELIQRDMKAIGLRIVFQSAQFPEQLKAARAARLMMFALGYGAVAPDGQVSLARLYGPAAGGLNLSRFRLPAADALYDRLLVLPDGPERLQAFDQAKRLAAAYLPEKTLMHTISAELWQARLIGYRPATFGTRRFDVVDVAAGRSG